MEKAIQSQRRGFSRAGNLLRSALKVLPILALSWVLSACKDHQLSGSDLQKLKRETLQAREGTISDQQKFRISAIQARTRADYDREVSRILSDSGGNQKKN